MLEFELKSKDFILIFIEGRGRSNWRGGFRRGRGKKILF
jgi:hypothetical protein